MAERRKGKGARRSAGDWRSLLAKFDGSGMGVEEFCRREAISAASFYRWRHRLGIESRGGQEASRARPPAFVDLGTLKTVPASRFRIDLKLDLGECLTLHLVRT